MTILLIALAADEVTAQQKKEAQALAQGREVVITNRADEIEPLLEQIEIAVASFPVSMLERAPNLRWFQTWGAGTDWLLRYPQLQTAAFQLTNASGVHSINISEHILAMMLAFSRRIPQAVHAQRERTWQNGKGAWELAGQTMLLVGLGAIGKYTAKLAKALGMRVVGVRRKKGQPVEHVDQMATNAQLPDLLPEADWLVLTVPLTRATHHMINREALASMKPSAHIINIGRGATIDEAALIDALRDKTIAGAGLDVFQEEPLPASSPLWDMENVLITAHYSGETPYYHERAWKIFMENLRRYTAGKPLHNLVDKEHGY